MADENGNGAADEAEENPAFGAEEIEILRAEIAALKDRSLRALAEAENTRKRAEREREEMKQFAIARFARDLLSVSDNLSRAMAALPGDARDGASDAVKAILDGIGATERELQTVLERHGVKPIEATGAKFDPNLHQAIAEVPSADQPPGTVVTVVQGGYTIGERLLRPAMVTVAKAADAPKA